MINQVNVLMKNISLNLSKLWLVPAAVVGVGLSLVSCEDFLFTDPLNEVVETNYWDRKADVESVVYGCYSGFQSKECQQRMFLWGEARSENVTYTSGTDVQLKQILGENILESSAWVNWKDFYTIINRCNTVIERAPGVQAIDPNYTYSEMKAHIAEVTWLRTLAYFYLVRTFRDVPYSDKASTNDENVKRDYCLAPTPFKEMLKKLSDDLEAVKDDALRYYPLKDMTSIKSEFPYSSVTHAFNNPSNTSRVTKCAFYALLADLYLWQGEYQKCIENTELVFKYKRQLYDEAKEYEDSYVEDINLAFDKYPLISDNPLGSTMGNAYRQIFYGGNSFESIFELYFQQNKSPNNEIVPYFFGSASGQNQAGQFTAWYGVRQGVYEGNNELYDQNDFRPFEYMENKETEFPIRKYYRASVSIKPPVQSGKEPTFTESPDSRRDAFSNWIIYRLTDVMLMRAEALIELDGEDNLQEAFELISAVYNRACGLKVSDSRCLKYEDYSGQVKMRELVQKERNRELIFEGKRWFDLVRYTLREPNNDKLIAAVIGKQKEKPTAVRIQLQSRDALFWPYLKTELDVNENLKQNPAYITNETSEK